MTATTQALTFADAKKFIALMLADANDDADAVYRALREAERNVRQTDRYTTSHQHNYAMCRLALADVSGDPKYRG